MLSWLGRHSTMGEGLIWPKEASTVVTEFFIEEGFYGEERESKEVERVQG